MIPNYNINLFWSNEDACWIADVPDLEYCSAHGASPSEAAAEATIMIRGVVDSLIERSESVPPARYRPAIYSARAA